MILSWSQRLEVGYPIIDEQHRELISRFNDLLEACRKGQGKHKVAELFGFLDSYVVSHFAAEETLMAEYAYPDGDEHRAQHAVLIAKLAEQREALRQGGPSFDLVIDANQMLFDWIVEHIRKADVKLGAFLKACALAC